MAPTVEMVSPVTASENQKSIKVLDELMSKLVISRTPDEVSSASKNLASFLSGPIQDHTIPTK